MRVDTQNPKNPMRADLPRSTRESSTAPSVAQRYCDILASVALAAPDDNIEGQLTEAFELGRAAVDQGIPPDELTNMHHLAVMALADAHPQLGLAQIASQMTRPLMEMSMAYGLAFRQQMQSRYENMVNTRLEESRKLEAIGTLAAGIAHDFNNLLGSIVGFAEMAGDSFKEGEPGKYNIEQVLKASFRARDLVARMLTFARQSPAKAMAVDVVREVPEVIALLRASLLPSVELVFVAEVERARIWADPSQIQQIIMNLCINAADAMNDHGTIMIRLAPLSDASHQHAAGAQAAQHICLSVSDNGSGISPEALNRVFDPFFTTKAPGKGSGLGLSVVYGIVTSLGGNIKVESRTRGEQRGTEFKVVLPLLAWNEVEKEEQHGEHPGN